MSDSLGDRMKGYEDVNRNHIPSKLPLILRLDGKAFHTYTRGLERPFSDKLFKAMDDVTKYLCKNIQNVTMAYTQSDEISLLLVDYKTIEAQQWFNGNIQKMVSVAASMASSKMTQISSEVFGEIRPAMFDCRAFILPVHEVENYFIWRQQDWTRNSIQMLARSLYSHKELHGKNTPELHEMCFQKGTNWNDLTSHQKNGRVAVKETYEPVTMNNEVAFYMPTTGPWEVMPVTPIFKDNRKFIHNLCKF